MKWSNSLKILSLVFFIAPVCLVLGIIFTETTPACGSGPSSQDEILLGIAGVLVSWIFAFLLLLIGKRNQSYSESNIKTKLLAIFLITCCMGIQVYGVVEWTGQYIEKEERENWLTNNDVDYVFVSQDYNAFPKLLKLPDGVLWSVWYQGDWHIDSKNDGKLLQSFSYDNGTTWTKGNIIFDDPKWDTRNPAIGQLNNGSLLVQALLYNYDNRSALTTQWIQSNDNGTTWTAPKTIENQDFNSIDSPTKYSWNSPFGNIFYMGNRIMACIYGGTTPGAKTEAYDGVILIEFNQSTYKWQYYTTVIEGTIVGFNEADIEQIGTDWVCISRSSAGVLYYAYSSDGKTWSAPIKTPYEFGHSPDMVVMGESKDPKQTNGTYDLFCGYRGPMGLFRGGLAHYNPTTKTFTCEDTVLYAAEGDGGGDFGYCSAVRIGETHVGFVNYDVFRCDQWDQRTTTGKITWQVWEWSAL
jgi:BNR repeat-like domain